MHKILLAILILLISSSSTHSNTAKLWSKELSAFGISGQIQTWHYQKDNLNRKKKSEALAFLPSHAIADSITVVFWFHGCNGYSDRTFDVRLAQQMSRVSSRNHSYALVVPELLWSKNTKTKCGRQSKSFRKSGDLIRFVNNSLNRINQMLVASGKEKMIEPRIVFVGHSAGGSVFKAAAISGDLCKINPDTVVWSDSTYGDWFNSAWNNCLNKGGSEVVVLIRKWTMTWKSFKKFPQRLNPPEFLDIKYFGGKIYHSTIGDNALEFADVFPEGC